MHTTDARRARRLLAAQLLTTALLALAAAVGGGAALARDVLIGGGAALLGNALFALWVFRPYKAAEPGRIVTGFYGGELVKIASVAAVFGLAVALLEDLEPVAVFGAFLVVQVLPPLAANRIAR